MTHVSDLQLPDNEDSSETPWSSINFPPLQRSRNSSVRSRRRTKGGVDHADVRDRGVLAREGVEGDALLLLLRGRAQGSARQDLLCSGLITIYQLCLRLALPTGLVHRIRLQ